MAAVDLDFKYFVVQDAEVVFPKFSYILVTSLTVKCT